MSCGIAETRAADLSPAPDLHAASDLAPDPVFAAIAATRAARDRHNETCAAMHADESEAAERACNAAGHAVDLADAAMAEVWPTTAAGFAALVDWYAEDVHGMDNGATYLARLSALLKHPDSTRWLAPQGVTVAPEISAGLPGIAEIEAAWRSLPAEPRDRIGVAVVDMVFQEFVYGDDCVVHGQPEDRVFPDESPEHIAIRCAAMDASNARLNELTPLVHGLFPHLFGAEGENPAWCPNPGPRPNLPIGSSDIAAEQGHDG